MKSRLLVAAIGIPLLLVIFVLLPPVVTAILVSGMSVVAVYELLYRTGFVRNLYVMIVSAVMALAIPLWSFGGCPWNGALIGLWLYFVALFVITLASRAKLPFQELCVAAFSGIVVPLFLSALVRLLMMEYGKFYILIPLAQAFGSDSGAYFAGKALGRHKLAPSISPKKTWEGAAGGVLGGALVMVLYTLFIQLVFGQNVSYVSSVLLGISGSVIGVVGDLGFSVIKRQSGLKDYGNLLPGHGGILDRFDSMFLIAPLTEIMITMIPLIVS